MLSAEQDTGEQLVVSVKCEKFEDKDHCNTAAAYIETDKIADDELVVRARFIADSREGVLAQGAEFLKAKAAGLVGDDHVVGEIGQVLDGKLEGRQSPEQITIYKSLGHVVQDLAAAQALYEAA